MPGFFEPFKNWFGYDRKERRASLVLLVLILFVLVIRMTYPSNKTEILDLTPEYTTVSVTDDESPVFFDPNKASLDILLQAGLDETEARTLINYRNKGGRFRAPSDIRKLYGIDSSEAERLIYSIRIETDSTRHNSKQQWPIELNSCDSTALDRLPGIGPVLSARIIRYRSLLGGFVSVDQLKEVYGLSPETFDLIKGKIEVDPSQTRIVNINTADYNELTLLPYLKKYQLVGIIKYREIRDSIVDIKELVENKIIPDSVAQKVRKYIIF